MRNPADACRMSWFSRTRSVKPSVRLHTFGPVIASSCLAEWPQRLLCSGWCQIRARKPLSWLSRFGGLGVPADRGRGPNRPELCASSARGRTAAGINGLPQGQSSAFWRADFWPAAVPTKFSQGRICRNWKTPDPVHRSAISSHSGRWAPCCMDAVQDLRRSAHW